MKEKKSAKKPAVLFSRNFYGPGGGKLNYILLGVYGNKREQTSSLLRLEREESEKFTSCS